MLNISSSLVVGSVDTVFGCTHEKYVELDKMCKTKLVIIFIVYKGAFVFKLHSIDTDAHNARTHPMNARMQTLPL